VASNRSTGLACGTSGKSLAVVNAQCMLSEILGDGYELMKFDKALPSLPISVSNNLINYNYWPVIKLN
jgi:hypothetical protein